MSEWVSERERERERECTMPECTSYDMNFNATIADILPYEVKVFPKRQGMQDTSKWHHMICKPLKKHVLVNSHVLDH